MTSTDPSADEDRPGGTNPGNHRTRKVLVTGGDGQLGRDLVERFDSYGWKVTAPARSRLDVTDRDAVLDLIGSTRPM